MGGQLCHGQDKTWTMRVCHTTHSRGLGDEERRRRGGGSGSGSGGGPRGEALPVQQGHLRRLSTRYGGAQQPQPARRYKHHLSGALPSDVHREGPALAERRLRRPRHLPAAHTPAAALAAAARVAAAAAARAAAAAAAASPELRRCLLVLGADEQPLDAPLFAAAAQQVEVVGRRARVVLRPACFGGREEEGGDRVRLRGLGGRQTRRNRRAGRHLGAAPGLHCGAALRGPSGSSSPLESQAAVPIVRAPRAAGGQPPCRCQDDGLDHAESRPRRGLCRAGRQRRVVRASVAGPLRGVTRPAAGRTPIRRAGRKQPPCMQLPYPCRHRRVASQPRRLGRPRPPIPAARVQGLAGGCGLGRREAAPLVRPWHPHDSIDRPGEVGEVGR